MNPPDLTAAFNHPTGAAAPAGASGRTQSDAEGRRAEEPEPEKQTTPSYDFEALEKLATSPHEADQAKFREILDGDPKLFKKLGDFHHLAEQAVASLATSKRPMMMAGAKYYAEQVRESLLSSGASEWERHCAAHAVLCLQAAQALHSRVYSDLNANLDLRFQRALDAAERRFQQSLKSVQLAQQISRDAASRPLRLVRGGERRVG